jgi:topoisomerase-4 subunit A
VSVAAFADALQVLGTGRGGKAREEVLRGAALEPHVGRRARKGRRQDAMPKAMRVVAATTPEAAPRRYDRALRTRTPCRGIP